MRVVTDIRLGYDGVSEKSEIRWDRSKLVAACMYGSAHTHTLRDNVQEWADGHKGEWEQLQGVSLSDQYNMIISGMRLSGKLTYSLDAAPDPRTAEHKMRCQLRLKLLEDRRTLRSDACSRMYFGASLLKKSLNSGGCWRN